MLELGPIAFAAPFYLAALLVLPVIWWLLRTTPPAPRRIGFPAVRLLLGLRETEETPARTPWWLLLLRMVLAALIIVALSRPVVDPDREFAGSGPLLLVVDNGWASAAGWQERRQAMDDLITRAGREGRAIAILPTAPTPDGRSPTPPRPLPAGEAVELAQSLSPHPWPVDRAALIPVLDDIGLDGSANVVWLSDGLDLPGTDELAAQLQQLGSLRVLVDRPERQPLLMLPPSTTGARLDIEIQRPAAGSERRFWLRATDEAGDVVTRRDGTLISGERTARIDIDLPPERRNRITRLAIESQAGAGSMVLLDERWRRRPVGLVSGRTLEKAQPLLSDLYYLERALDPFSDVRRGQMAELINDEIVALVLADVGTLTPPEVDSLEAWIAGGGVLIRFSGPRLSQGSDDLVPVRLRRGDRALGGVMSWSKPARLAPFEDTSPFAGLTVPEDVEIQRQILAQPSVDLVDKTWVRLSDGTPLVTADQRGDGWLVLVHTTANSDWSNLPLSGLFVDLMQRLIELGDGTAGDANIERLVPIEIADGFGRLGPAPATTRSIASTDWPTAVATAATPPGYYGGKGLRRALNLFAGVDSVRPLGNLPTGVSRDYYGTTHETDILPWLLTAALILVLADLMISLMLRGLVAARASAAAAGLACFIFLVPSPGGAQEFDDPFSIESIAKRASLGIHLAYVLTGIPQVDDVSHDGLRGLNRILTRRTSVEPGEPFGVDIETDDLSVHPILYWPVITGQKPPSGGAVARLNNYLRNGGMILFDTRDHAPSVADNRSAVRLLRQLVNGLDIPPLIPVPPEHVLTKSFYLLSEFPGRWQGGTLWVEDEPQVNDGVSSVIVGGHDWAGAWAIDIDGRPKFAVVPDGDRQREMAFRFGVNLVMYALTGNYKADQVHIPAIMERLGL